MDIDTNDLISVTARIPAGLKALLDDLAEIKGQAKQDTIADVLAIGAVVRMAGEQANLITAVQRGLMVSSRGDRIGERFYQEQDNYYSIDVETEGLPYILPHRWQVEAARFGYSAAARSALLAHAQHRSTFLRFAQDQGHGGTFDGATGERLPQELEAPVHAVDEPAPEPPPPVHGEQDWGGTIDGSTGKHATPRPLIEVLAEATTGAQT